MRYPTIKPLKAEETTQFLQTLTAIIILYFNFPNAVRERWYNAPKTNPNILLRLRFDIHDNYVKYQRNHH